MLTVGVPMQFDESILHGQKRLLELLLVLHERGRFYQAQLEPEGWNRVTMTNILRKLVEKGLAVSEVEFCGRNGTRVWYTLTPKGVRLVEILKELKVILEER